VRIVMSAASSASTGSPKTTARNANARRKTGVGFDVTSASCHVNLDHQIPCASTASVREAGLESSALYAASNVKKQK